MAPAYSMQGTYRFRHAKQRTDYLIQIDVVSCMIAGKTGMLVML